MILSKPLGRARGPRVILEEAETSGAGTRHLGENPARLMRERFQYLFDHRRNAGRGRLEIVARVVEIIDQAPDRVDRRRGRRDRAKARPDVQRREDVRRRHGDARIDENEGKGRQRPNFRHALAPPRHPNGTRKNAGRNIGADFGCEGAKLAFAQPQIPKCVQTAQTGSRVGRSAAQAGCDGKIFFKRKRGAVFCLQRPRGTQNEIIFGGLKRARERARNGEAQRIGIREVQAVAHLREHDQAFEIMISVARMSPACRKRLIFAGAQTLRLGARAPPTGTAPGYEPDAVAASSPI